MQVPIPALTDQPLADEALADIQPDDARAARTAHARTCIVTRTTHPVGALIRFVLGPDGTVVPDVKRRLPGRGVWVTARRTAVTEACRKRLFARAFKAQVKVSDTLPGDVEALLEQSALNALSIARKAGLVIHGFAKVEAAVAATRPPFAVALIRARDGGADAGRRLAHAFLRRGAANGAGDDTTAATAATPEPAPAKIVEAFTSAQLDLALGRLNVIHAALLAGRASEAFLVRWRFLEDFRADAPVSEGPHAQGSNSTGTRIIND